jgi:hypothetical protein
MNKKSRIFLKLAVVERGTIKKDDYLSKLLHQIKKKQH